MIYDVQKIQSSPEDPQFSKPLYADGAMLNGSTWIQEREPSEEPKNPAGFSVLAFYDNKVRVAKGFVVGIDPNSSASPVLSRTVPSNWVSEDTEFSVSAGQTLFVRVQTTAKDQVTGATLVVDSNSKASTHAQPGPSVAPQLTVLGDYYYPIAEFYDDGGTLRYRQIHAGVIVHRPVLWTGKNIGAAVELFKQHKQTTNEFEFRTLKNIAAGTGVSVLKDNESPQGDNIQFRKIDAASASPLQVTLIGETVTVRGNGYAGPGTGLVKDLVTQDGLVTSYAVATAGWWGTITFQDGGGDSRLRETYQDGRLVKVEVQGSSGGATWQDRPGTQASPGAASVVVL